MNFFSNLKIGPRLGLVFATLIALAAVVVVIGITRLSALHANMVEIGGDHLPKVVKTVEVSDQIALVARELPSQLIWEDKAKVVASVEAIKQARAKAGQILEELAPTLDSDEEKRHLAAVTAARGEYRKSYELFMELVAQGNKADATQLLGSKLVPTQLAYLETLERLRTWQLATVDSYIKQGGTDYTQARWLMFGLLAGMGALGALLARLSQFPPDSTAKLLI